LNRILRLSGCGLLVCAELCADDAADKATFEKVCGNCHASSMVSDLKTQDEWAETVGNMVSIGAKGTKEQFDAVLRYLAHNFTRVNINTAPASEIAPVLDVTEAVAQTVVDYRTSHGSFTTLDQVKQIPGLDAAKIDARKDRIAFR
jgi:competence protein ComEA